MNFRQAISKDIDSIYSIEKRVFDDSWSYESIDYEITKGKHSSAFVVEKDLIIIGYIFIRIIFNEGHIINFAIDTQFQHQGFGKFLLKKSLAILNGNTNVFLEVKEANLPAIKLYSDFGFEEFNRKENYYSDGSGVIFMTKKYKIWRGLVEKDKNISTDASKKDIPSGLWTKCPSCSEIQYKPELEKTFLSALIAVIISA